MGTDGGAKSLLQLGHANDSLRSAAIHTASSRLPALPGWRAMGRQPGEAAWGGSLGQSTHNGVRNTNLKCPLVRAPRGLLSQINLHCVSTQTGSREIRESIHYFPGTPEDRQSD